MDTGRRRALALAATSIPIVTLAGCLGDEAPVPGDDGTPSDEGTPDDDATPSPVDGPPPRVDEPPYDVSEPDCGGDGRDPLWLCANMAGEPSLAFDQVETPTPVLADEGLRTEDGPAGSQFYAASLTDETDTDRVADDADGDAVDLIEGTAFDEAMVLVAETGWGSGTVTPHLKRVEETDEGIHAFGCYRRPCGGTADVTMRTVVARVDRPDRLDSAVVSLTADADSRVTFAVGEGVVTVEEDL